MARGWEWRRDVSGMCEELEITMNQITTKHTTHSLTILGSEQSGKTCFLAGLGILSEGDRPSDIMLSSEGESKKMIRELSAIFRAQEWPAGTTMEHNFMGTLRYKRRDIKIHMVEYAGEQFREGFSGGREKPQNLLNALNHSQFLLLALDPHVELARDEILASSNEDRDRYHARLDSLMEALVQKQRERDGKDPFQVGLLITKADLLGEDVTHPEQAEAYVKKTAPNFYQKLSREFKDLRTFAVSAVGRTERDANGRMIPAKDLEPWGYEHVFNWVLGEIKRKKRKSRIIRVFLGIIIIGLLWMVLSGIQNYWSRQNASKWDQMVRLGIESNEMEEAERLARKLDSTYYKEQVDQLLKISQERIANSSVPIGDAEKTLNALRALAFTKNSYRLADLHKEISDWSSNLEEQHYKNVKLAYEQGGDDFSGKAQQFLDTYPNSRYRDEIQQRLDEKIQSRFASAVRSIYKKTIESEAALREKIDMIHEFLNNNPNVTNKADIGKAAELATKLIQETKQRGMTIELNEMGTLASAGYLSLKIFLQGSSDPVIDVKSPEKTDAYSFENNKRHELPWKLGQAITIELYYDNGWVFSNYVLVARTTLSWVFALGLLENVTELRGVDGGEENFINHEPAIRCDVIGWDDNDWQLLYDWIAPGNEWNKLITNE